MNRENWGSRFGFIMAAAGSAIGLGNVWRFPYVAGENGGGAFLLIYLVIVAVFGFSLAMTEIALGRATQRNPVGAFRALGGRRWMPAGFLGVAAGFVILSFYSVVGGWTLAYALKSLSGQLADQDAQALGATFGANDEWGIVIGVRGGVVVAEGTPEDVSRVEKSHTGRFLKQILR